MKVYEHIYHKSDRAGPWDYSGGCLGGLVYVNGRACQYAKVFYVITMIILLEGGEKYG